MSTRTEVAAGLERALVDLDDARRAAASLNDPLLVGMSDALYGQVATAWLALDGANDTSSAIVPRWRRLGEAIEAAADTPPAGWEITRTIVPDGWRVRWLATGGEVQVITGQGYCGEVVPDRQRLGTVRGDDGTAPTIELLEAALGVPR